MIPNMIDEFESRGWDVLKSNGREMSVRGETDEGYCVINLSEDRDGVRIDLIRARPVGQGGGSFGMAALCECADSAGVTLVLDVRPQPGGLLDEIGLLSWYERSGFSDDPCSGVLGMIRDPEGPSLRF